MKKSPIREYCFGYLGTGLVLRSLMERWTDAVRDGGIRQRKWDYSKFKAFKKLILGGGFKYFLFSTLFGEDSQFDEHIFQVGWFNHQLMIVFGSFISLCWRDEHSWARDDSVDWEARKKLQQRKMSPKNRTLFVHIYLFLQQTLRFGNVKYSWVPWSIA